MPKAIRPGNSALRDRYARNGSAAVVEKWRSPLPNAIHVNISAIRKTIVAPTIV